MTNPNNIQTYADFLSILRRSTGRLTDDPIKEEIFSVERIEQYASYLAHEFKISPQKKSRRRSLLPEIKACGDQLHSAYLALQHAARGKQVVSPAAEWFLDNFFIIEEQFLGIKRDLPKGYYDELPKLSTGELAGYPRVYALALALIAHTDSRLDLETLKRYIRSFQQVAPLQIGELWAMQITLRIALLEHLNPLAQRIVKERKRREQADALADKLLELAALADTESHQLIQVLAEECERPEAFDRAFIVQLIQRLRDQDPDVWPVFDWLERKLKHFSTDTDQITLLELHRQAAAQVTVGNIITSMRLLSALNWRDFVENVSFVDEILKTDPAQAYDKMDFATRDQYRHAIERIARRSLAEELEVAQASVDHARLVLNNDKSDERRSHVGFYLIGEGRDEFEKRLQYKLSIRERIYRSILRRPTLFYLGGLTFLTALSMGPIINHFVALGGSWIGVLFFSLLALIPASEFSLIIFNHYLTFSMKPKRLPKMETENGVQEASNTMVVIPTLFTKESVVKELIERLEVHYLGNIDPSIYFGLLGDFSDAATETHLNDDALLALAQKGIDDLNFRYTANALEPRFFLFCRPRQWNPSEGKWIGWERKRGKLLEFNRLLRGATDTSYFAHQIDPAVLQKVKYVITLDSDTQLPRNCARRLIGTITHPLNRPYYNPLKQRVTSGYGILQPRVSVDLLSAGQTRFSRIFSGNTGFDPYTTAVSDVYQDLFAEGSFTGKGLYVVDAFETALADRGPENSVLSHDLFEGSYARAALVTDIELYDDYPSDYDSFLKRQHRWVRGDWQIAPWLLGRVPNAKGEMVPNNLSLISRFKIFDNLRRSLVAPAVFIWLILGWIFFPGSPLFWTFTILALLSFPVYAPLLTGSCLDRGNLPWREHFRIGITEAILHLEQMILMAAFLASQAFMQIDAILRTIYRKMVSRKKLLEWLTFAQIETSQKNVFSFSDFLSPAPLSAFVVAALLVFLRSESLGVALPFLILWLTNPLIKAWLKIRRQHYMPALDENEKMQFRKVARRTWRFFEVFIRPSDHWLAPDNFQEDPSPVVARRTSPTNIGLQLLATVSAYDLGYLGRFELIELLEKVIEVMEGLPKLNGHFFNWYDTEFLHPLQPEYISTVDSGNLAGHLLALKQACLEISKGSAVNLNAKRGLEDTLMLLIEETEKGGDDVLIRPFLEAIKRTLLSVQSSTWEEIIRQLEKVEALPEGSPEGRALLESALRQVRSFARDETFPDEASAQSRLQSLAKKCDDLMLGMNFRFLFDEARKIFSIGFNVPEGRKDLSFYDLLASESRLASFVAIAKGDVPEEHWFKLGRQVTLVKGSRALVAWTATMFEYLMPVLVMRRFPETLLEQTYLSIVKRQIEYGSQHSVPWGISESGYHARDINLNYQYGPFGIPGLGLKRGLSDDLVISPYSTFLAAMIDPKSAGKNVKVLTDNGVLARYGFYEAIDYTPERLPENQKSALIRSFMAHHQGMSLVSINNLLSDGIMQNRFHAEPRVRATTLLLQERIAQAVPISKPRAEEVHREGVIRLSTSSNPRFYSDFNVATPRTQLLSNGTYSVMMTSGGGGYSLAGKIAMNRFNEDWTRDHSGQFFYIRDRHSGRLWSSAYQPTVKKPDKYEVTFAEDKVEFLRSDDNILTRTEVIVSPEDPVELRRISLTNHSNVVRELVVTSFQEVVLAKSKDDAAHPAFSNLFVQTEFLTNENVLLATRRKRSAGENQVWGFHVMVTEGEVLGPIEYETDRSVFLGRGRGAHNPAAVERGRGLSNTVGSVLDPVFSLRVTVRIPAHSTVKVVFSTGITSSREEALRLADKYHDIHIFPREAEIAWTQAQIHLRHLNVTNELAHTFQRLASRIIFSDPLLRPKSHQLALNSKGQSALWAYGISGDLPIILTRITDEKDMLVVRELLHCHEYLRLKGLEIDLVILNERPPSYLQALQEALQRQIRMSGSQALIDKPGGIFIRRTDIMPKEDVTLLKSVARVIVNAENGTLDEQLKRRTIENELPKMLQPRFRKRNDPIPRVHLPELKFFNGLGGFSPNGKNYIILLNSGQHTPAPWINVIANSHDFGFIVSESGGGYTWSVNSRENRLTSWSNDPVSDPVSEAIYIRDEESGEYWSPTPLPIRQKEPYLITHGAGFTQFDHTSHGIEQELKLFVPIDATVKISRLRLKNLGTETRHLSVTSYVEWVLGFKRETSAPFVVTELDSETGALIARNSYNNEFSERIAFSEISESTRSFTGDRREFLGRNGSPAQPAALGRKKLSGRVGAGADPCAAFQTRIELVPGEEREIIVLLGEADTIQNARLLITKYRSLAESQLAFEEMQAYWAKTLGAIQIKTPDPAMDILMNQWLLYQNLSCRVWARSAFYQSGGAYGFRDQLQDVMALVYSDPKIARDQLLRASARQFKEGDVQHWWHPPTGRGVRTHFSDDLIWLPFVLCFYINKTGDRSILGEIMPFIEAPLLEVGQDDSYLQPQVSNNSASLVEHCARALDHSLRVGVHGLPLMGSGDWNDGMNRVGHEGKGESVWVAWFLINTLEQFIPFCESAGDLERANRYRIHVMKLKKAIEENAWDGEWYKRAFFDNGEALGSISNHECRIDSLAQTWAVLSGAGDLGRSKKAMASVDEYLIHRKKGIIQLFTPPFDKGSMDPGYIKGYVPGVRENGGQYTHAAIWVVMAYAMLSDRERASSLYSLLNPINRAATPAGVERYKVEPYVMAADVYGMSPHEGRGGWTWYTGSASWMYRAALESILGFDLRANVLRMKPCIPKHWPGFEMNYRYGVTEFKISVKNEAESDQHQQIDISLDGVSFGAGGVPLVDDGKTHLIQVQLSSLSIGKAP